MALSIELVGESEAPAAIALLPQTAALPCEWLIARRDGALAGAIAIAWRAWGSPGGLPIAIEVLPGARRRGVGRALVSAAREIVAEDTDGLWTLGHFPLAGAQAAFLHACGFEARRRQLRFEASIEALLRNIARLAARARRSLPAEARIVPLSEAPLEEAGWLMSAEFGGGPFRALHGLERRAADEDNDHSLAMMVGDELAGMVLWRTAGGIAHVDARVVAPRWRRGWTNLLLLEAGLTAGLHKRLARMRFHCDDTVRDTISLARRCGADELEAGAYYYAAIA